MELTGQKEKQVQQERQVLQGLLDLQEQQVLQV